MVLYAKNNAYTGQGKFADLVMESQGNQTQNFSVNPDRSSIMLHTNRISSIQCDLTIIVWNADSLQPRIEELREFLAYRKPDVLLLSETCLRAQDTVSYACLLYTSRCV